MRRHILVIEDDPAVRMVVARHLRRRGFDVTDIADADAVLVAAQQRDQRYDLVVTDVHLEGVFTGVELMDILLAHAPLRPVVVMTGDRNSLLARDALARGAAGYLVKPFELFELDAVVQEVLFRVELMEATRAYTSTEHGADDERSRIPPAWLKLTDARSGAGAGHSARVADIANLLAAHPAAPLSAADRTALDVAARAHELGRMAEAGPAMASLRDAGANWQARDSTGPALAVRTERVLGELGLGAGTIQAVRGMYERWDGRGGPDGLREAQIPITSQILAVADAVDHGASAEPAEREPETVIAASIDAVLAGSGSVFSPAVCVALARMRPQLCATWSPRPVGERGAATGTEAGGA